MGSVPFELLSFVLMQSLSLLVEEGRFQQIFVNTPTCFVTYVTHQKDRLKLCLSCYKRWCYSPRQKSNIWTVMMTLWHPYIILSYHILSSLLLSYLILSYRVMPYHIISYNILSYHTVDCFIISYDMISYHIISYPTISYSILFCSILSDPI